MSLTTVVQWMSEQRQLGQAIALVLDSEDERETRQQLLRSCDYERYCGVYHQTPVSSWPAFPSSSSGQLGLHEALPNHASP